MFPVTLTLKTRDGKPLANQKIYPEMQTRGQTAADIALMDAEIREAETKDPVSYVTDSKGRVTVMIEGGKTAVIQGIPHGTSYQAEQPKGSMPQGVAQGTAEGATGVIRGGEESQVTFTNNYGGNGRNSPTPQPTSTSKPHPVPKTGDSAPLLLWLGMILLGMIGMGVTALRKSGKK